MKRIFSYIFCLLFCALCFTGCGPNKNVYDIDSHLGQNLRDSVLADVITYIYKRPKYSSHETKWESKYRPYYVGLIDSMNVLYYHADKETNEHFIMLSRPVRSGSEKNRRGVLAKFRLVDNKIADFQEILNTPILEADTVVARVVYLWQEYMAFKQFDRYYLNTDYVEFPNLSCRYDFERKEWRYDTNTGETEPAASETKADSVGTE